MGQNNAAPRVPSLTKQGYLAIRTPPLRSLAAHTALFQKADLFLAHSSYPLDPNGDLLQHDRYYTDRASVAHPHLLGLSWSDLVDSGSGVSVREELGNTARADGKKTNVNSLCSLNVFQQHCQKTADTPLNPSSLRLHLYHEYQGHTLESEIEMRRQCNAYFQESELWKLIATCASAGKALLAAGLKQPVLSPAAIKIDSRGNFKVAEWELSHFFEDMPDEDEETNFLEEGETFLRPSSSRLCSKTKRKGYNLLTNYYWAPEGTAGLQKIVSLGRKHSNAPSSQQQSNNQIFSLAMSILHICLIKSLYQSQTFSQKRINAHLKEAVAVRAQQGLPLSRELIDLLKKMLVWDSDDRIGYCQVSQLASSHKAPQPTQSVFTTESDSPLDCASFRLQLNPAKSLLLVEGSGCVRQGCGDTEHPLEESQKVNPPCTMRSNLHPDCSINYEKIDFTIKRERREWQRFQNRIQEDSYKVRPTNNPCTRQLFPTSFFSFPAETLLQDGEDSPNCEALCSPSLGVSGQREEADTEEAVCDINCTTSIDNSIKLLDISNIKAQDETKDISKPRHSFIRVDAPQEEESFSHLFCQQKSRAEPSRQDTLLLKSSVAPTPALRVNTEPSVQEDSILHDNREESLFTPPELLALIRSSVTNSNHSLKSPKKIAFSLPPHIPPHIPLVASEGVQAELSSSVFVKESFAKGYYEGGKVDGLRSGYGTFYYKEGGKYCGDWENNQMHGKGTLYYADGRIAYQGEWSHDALKGKGVLYNERPARLNAPFDYRCFDQSEDYWVYYEGNFHQDDKWGHGVLLLSNGERYEGSFRHDLVHGRGVYYTMGGKRVIGEWQANQLTKLIREQEAPTDGEKEGSSLLPKSL